MPLSPSDHFERNVGYVRSLIALAVAVDTMTSSALDVTDVYRAALVHAVSALDHFIHEVVRAGMNEIALGERPQTDRYEKYTVPLASVTRALTEHPRVEWLDTVVRQQHALLSFQQPDKIAAAVGLISPVRLWDTVACELQETAEAVRIRLRLLVDRRNRIAHEADVNPTPPHDRWPITHADVERAVTFLDAVAHAIAHAVEVPA
jgi:hypothetical protein